MEESQNMMVEGHPLDLEQLQSLVAVVDSGGFTAAGRRLHRAQSTVSAHLARLERRTGHRLLDRGTLTPTPEGERLLAHAREMLRHHALAWQELRAARLGGRLRLGIPDDYLGFIPPLLTEFEERFPGVELTVECGLSMDLVRKVRAGGLDLAVVTRQPGSPGGETLRREPLWWAGASDHAAHRRDPLPLALSRRGTCIFREQALEALEASGRSWRVAYTGSGLAGLLAAVRAGLAVTVLTPSMMSAGLRPLGEAEGLPPLPWVDIALHRAPGRPTEPAARLAERLRQRLAATEQTAAS
ncbi:LysR family transcriptional regulator [Ectothiorhodospira mobilis]|uniref:LysR family transcriptional regulator n=1 Tax=Ectothiorhodospira mobilis TaxID=195064 RepID=UPI001F5BD103|nr:LysR family transcriptional regulator [Ectothiorhodospira mobilis]